MCVCYSTNSPDAAHKLILSATCHGMQGACCNTDKGTCTHIASAAQCSALASRNTFAPTQNCNSGACAIPCKAFKCNPGTFPLPSAADISPGTFSTCCQATCGNADVESAVPKSFTCTNGWTPDPAQANVTHPANDMCCNPPESPPISASVTVDLERIGLPAPSVGEPVSLVMRISAPKGLAVDVKVILVIPTSLKFKRTPPFGESQTIQHRDLPIRLNSPHAKLSGDITVLWVSCSVRLHVYLLFFCQHN